MHNINLNIGSSFHKINGFINCDKCTYGDSEIMYLDAEQKFPFENDSVDNIYSCHLIEHLSYNGFKNYLNESYRCLKQNGIHRMCFPSLNNITKILNNPELYKTYFINVLTNFNKEIICDFNLEEYIPYDFVINNLYLMWEHKYIYSVETVKRLCLQYNYKNVIETPLNISKRELFNDIEKNNNINDYFNFKQYESSVIECTK